MSMEHASFAHHATADAARWFTILQHSPVTDSTRMEFARWLSQSASHVEEYLRIAATWRLASDAVGNEYPAEELIRAARADLEASNVVRLDGALRRRPAAKLFMTMAAMLAIVTVLVARWAITRPDVSEYQTHLGKRLVVALGDGSTVRLNSETHLRVRLTRTLRDIELLTGEALFEVAKDARRPFRVLSAGSEIRALGTAFNVYKRADATTVTVIEGQVEVTPAPAISSVLDHTRTVPVRLRPRLQVNVRHGDGRLFGAQAIDPAPIIAWTRPLLRFSDQPLREVIEQFNQYNSTRLVLDAPDLAAVRVSGVFSSTDIHSFLQYLEQTEGVTTLERPDAHHIVRVDQ